MASKTQVEKAVFEREGFRIELELFEKKRAALPPYEYPVMAPQRLEDLRLEERAARRIPASRKRRNDLPRRRGRRSTCVGMQSSPAPVNSAAQNNVAELRAPSNPLRQDLLYVSNGANGDVAVYTFPNCQLVTTLLGLNAYGSGECADVSGNVFITTFNQDCASTIYEFAHGGTTPIATLADQGEATGCAVDPVGGNLAVSNRADYSSYNPYPDHGDLAIYTGAQGSPQMYYNASTEFPIFGFCGYDNQENLYLSAADYYQGGSGALLRFAAGSSRLALSASTPRFLACSRLNGTERT